MSTYDETLLRITESCSAGIITESEKDVLLSIIEESKEEGKLRYTKSKDDMSYANNINSTKLMITRMVDKLDKKYKNKEITKKEYQDSLAKLDRVGKKTDVKFDYVYNSDHGKDYDKIPDVRKELNRHTKKHLGIENGKNKEPKYSRDPEQPHTYTTGGKKETDRAKRLVKRLVSSDNFSGINKRNEGDHETTFKQLAKQTGLNKDDSIRVDRQINPNTKKEQIRVTDKTAGYKDANKKVENPNQELYRVSASKNATMARPSNKSTDSIIYPNSRIYYSQDTQSASGAAPAGKAQYPYKRSSSNKNKDIRYDPEIADKKSVYVKTRDKEHVKPDDSEAKRVNTANKNKINDILGSFYSKL